MVTRRLGAALLGLLLLPRAPGAGAQEPAAPAATPSVSRPAAPTPSPASSPGESLSRETPRGSVTGFLLTTDRGDHATAAGYLNLRRIPAGERSDSGPTLARELKTVLARTRPFDLEALSEAAEGQTDDGLAPGVERIGSIALANARVDLLLERVRTPDGRREWLFSSSTVERVPALYDQLGYGVLDRLLPDAAFEIRYFGLALWQWGGLLVVLLVSWFLARVVSRLSTRLARPIVARTPNQIDDQVVEALHAPARLAASVLLLFAGAQLLALPGRASQLLASGVKGLLIVAVTWLALRSLDLMSRLAERRLVAQGQAFATAAVRLGQRTAQVFVAAIALVVLLQNVGFNVTGIVAGLGIGGLAVALAAQKTVENFIGGASLIFDRPVRVGDTCRVGDRVGQVLDIGLRSTRIRLLDRQIVTIPNGELSGQAIENHATRDMFRFAPVLGLRCDTTPDRLRRVLDELRTLLLAHPLVDRDAARVRLIRLGPSSLDVEVMAFIRTTDSDEYLAVAEELMLRILDLLEASGTGLALPSQTVYLGRDAGIGAERRGEDPQRD